MVKRFNNLEELRAVCIGKWNELNEIKYEYLSDTGLAAREAYRTIIWYLGFCDTIEQLWEIEEFQNLVNTPGKHPEYYKILRKVNRCIEESLK